MVGARGEHVDNTVTLGGLHLAARVIDGADCAWTCADSVCIRLVSLSASMPSEKKQSTHT